MQRSKLVRNGTVALAALIGLAVSGPAHAKSKSESKVKTPFVNTGVLPSAEGYVEFAAKPSGSSLEVEAEGLVPGNAYPLLFNGQEWTVLVADSRGEAEVEFESDPSGPLEPMLPGDPRGGTLVVSDGAQDILTAVVSGPGESAGTEVKEQGPLGLGDDLPEKAKAETKFEIKKGKTAFAIKADKLPAGAYMLLVGGEMKAAPFVKKDGGKVSLKFSNPLKSSKDMDLDFDPRDDVVELHGPTGMAASGSASADIEGLTTCDESEVEVALQAVAGVGKGKSELKVDDDCDQSFEVEIENVPVGFYDVYVDGILRGTIHAVFDASKGEVQGELEWETDPDDPDELLLNFDPEGALVEVKQGDTVFFSGFQTPPVGGGGGAGGGPGVCTPLETQVALTNTGAIPGASGKAEFGTDDDCETDFEVEIEDVPPGTYDLDVGGVFRGHIVVGPLGEGEIEFETDPDDPDELPLNFDPRGMLIEVFDGGALLFERTFPG